ncbi:MAG: D-alanyl-D-alanine carboxypeptidase [Spirochaetaceae bacterium]|nr:D-alanyl-D-alanine carboxypeptidase [Spirochaetaceae bacterium]
MIRIIKKILFISVLLFSTNIIIYSLEPEPLLFAASAILYDYTTGRVLYEKDADKPIAPASMTKLITLYLGWQSIETGQNKRDDIIEITGAGSSFSRPPGSSLMLLEEGQKVSFIDIMKGLAISSGNDAAYALANQISGSESVFVNNMNQLVRSLGYKHMYFEDPDGWSRFNVITAREYAEFSADYIRTFPYALNEVHSQQYFTYPKEENLPPDGARIVTPRKKKNTNILLGKVDGVDGLKTGYIDESGFNFTATAKRDGSRFIAVILGIKDIPYFEGIALRAEEAEKLLEYGFRNYKTLYPEIPELKPILIWEGREDTVAVEIERKPEFTLSIDEMPSFRSSIRMAKELIAPVGKGDILGSVIYKTADREVDVINILASNSVEKANIFKVLWHKIKRQFKKL